MIKVADIPVAALTFPNSGQECADLRPQDVYHLDFPLDPANEN
jgi:hypothetical protein